MNLKKAGGGQRGQGTEAGRGQMVQNKHLSWAVLTWGVRRDERQITWQPQG